MNDRKPEPNQNTEKGSFSEVTNRILALVQVIRAIAPFIWAAVILFVIIPLLGKFFMAKAFVPDAEIKNLNEPKEIVVETVDWSAVDRAMVGALKTARQSAKKSAKTELDIWVEELMNRVDDSFLDWYFGYVNQKTRELKSFFVQVSSGTLHLLNANNPTPSEKLAEVITRDFQEQFAKRVLRPQIDRKSTRLNSSHYS